MCKHQEYDVIYSESMDVVVGITQTKPSSHKLQPQGVIHTVRLLNKILCVLKRQKLMYLIVEEEKKYEYFDEYVKYIICIYFLRLPAG